MSSWAIRVPLIKNGSVMNWSRQKNRYRVSESHSTLPRWEINPTEGGKLTYNSLGLSNCHCGKKECGSKTDTATWAAWVSNETDSNEDSQVLAQMKTKTFINQSGGNYLTLTMLRKLSPVQNTIFVPWVADVPIMSSGH